MKHFVLLSLLVLIVISCVGCQSKKEPPIPEAKMFSLSITAPKEIQADKAFEVEGALVNNSDSSWEIEHGADMFTYAIYDGNGELVNQGVDQRMVNSIGLMKILKPNAAYFYSGEGYVQPKLNEFILHAGNYKMVAKAKFNIKQAGKDVEFDITSTPLEIKLAPR